VTPGSAVISRLVQNCQVCGRKFDPFSFQVVVPELGRGFDCVECARSARALGGAVAAAPLAAIAEPFTAAAQPAVVAVSSGRRSAAMPVATFGLIAVGAAAAAFLWLRVLGPETTAFQFSHAAVPPAFAHESVQAHVEPWSTHSVTRPAGPGESRPPVTLATVTLVSASPTSPFTGSTHRTPASLPVARAAPASSPELDESGSGDARHGKGHHKHGKGDHRHGWKATGHGHGKGDHGHKGQHGEHKGREKH